MKLKLLVMIIHAVTCWGTLEAAWIDRKAEGWAWYEDKFEPEQEQVRELPKVPKQAQEQLKEAKMLLEEKLAEAMITPSEQNLKSYMEEQQKWLQQSSKFAHMWEKVLLQNPELDPTASSPVTQYGIQLQKDIDNENKRQFISHLSKENGLFFFYEGHNKISSFLSKIIKKFSEKYNWNVVAISVDGGIIEDFSNTRLDNGISKQMGISIFPALFIINPKDKIATPVAYGLVTLDQIENKIMLQFKTVNEGENE